MCGEKCFPDSSVYSPVGSPPRVRGKGLLPFSVFFGRGITPACAGKSHLEAGPALPAWDHPRVCGEKTHFGQVVRPDWGSPPRVRGKAWENPEMAVRTGITPAYAGKSALGWLLHITAEGSPPRMRGKALSAWYQHYFRRITPAYAGKRWITRKLVQNRRDHPRVCGEKFLLSNSDNVDQGSPPRMRGKGSVTVVCCQHWGITPAYAGKRLIMQRSGSIPRDHPRVCGEKARRTATRKHKAGSPPRMRGKAPHR